MLISRSAVEGQLSSAAVPSGPRTTPVLPDIPKACPAATWPGKPRRPHAVPFVPAAQV